MNVNQFMQKEFLEKCRVLVVGDVILDQYLFGEVSRISPEAPVPIAHIKRVKKTLGGAANVAHNLRLLGCDVRVAGAIGNDIHAKELCDEFLSCDLKLDGLITTDNPTTTKLRIMGGHQQMLRLDFEEANQIHGESLEKLIAYLEKNLPECDAVILSDYGKGLCTKEVCEWLMAHKKNFPVIVDPKGSDWSKYKGANFITPNLKELREVQNVGEQNFPHEDEAVVKACRYVMKKFSLEGILSTRSEAGVTLVQKRKSPLHIRAKAQEVFDVSGAGDTVISVFALALAGNLSPEQGAYLANLAASVVVTKLGTYAISQEELYTAWQQDKKNNQK